jgi:PPP family 3-phenylpropionic acid transporter
VAAQVASIVYETIAPVAVFWCYGAGMLLTLLALRAVPLETLISQKSESRSDRPARNKGGVAKLLKNPSFLLFLALCLLFRGVLTVGTTYLQPLLMSHGLSVSASGTVVFIATMTEVPLLLFSGRMIDRIRSRPALMACFAALAGVLLCLGLSPALPPIIVASILRPLVGMVFNMLALKITMLLAPGDLTSTAIGLTGAAKCLGVIGFQSMGGSLMDAMGIGALFVFLAALSAVGLLLSLFCKVKDDPSRTLFAKK